MALDESIVSGQSGHLTDHQTLHAFHNTYQTDHNSTRYVATTGNDSNDGLTWETAKLTIASAQATSGTKAIIYVGKGTFNIDISIEMVDGQSIIGISPHGTFGTILQATATLGTDPVLKNSTGNLTAGGLFNMQIKGTNDGDGGVGIHITATGVADHWSMDNLNINNFTSHGIHFEQSSGIAGNPMNFGMLNFFTNGAGGTGDGIRLEKVSRSIYHFDYIGGDNNADSLIRLENLNEFVHVRIDSLKAERTVDSTHDDVITVNAAGSGALSIGSLWVLNTRSTGTTPNAIIRETGGTGLRYDIGLVMVEETGTKKYVNGFDDGTNPILLAEFTNRPWNAYVKGQGYRRGVLRVIQSNTPEGAQNGPIGSLYQRINGSDGTSLYVKTSGTGNTGWVPINGIVTETDASRPAANAVPTGYMIFNTDDGFPNWSDGTNWVISDGTTT